MKNSLSFLFTSAPCILISAMLLAGNRKKKSEVRGIGKFVLDYIDQYKYHTSVITVRSQWNYGNPVNERGKEEGEEED